MSDTTHTPGPWTAHPTYHGGDGKRQTGFFIDSETRMVVMGEPAAAMGIPEMQANARLIAAAPDLLNAAKLAVMMLGVEAQMHRENQYPKKADAVEKAIGVIRAAITKAEG